MKGKGKTKRNLLIETNRRLQETSQKLFIAKQELEKKTVELEEARLREKQQKEHLARELKTLKGLARPWAGKATAKSKLSKPLPGKKLTGSDAEGISLEYIQLLRSYLKTKDLDKEEPLVQQLCQNLIRYGITPKGIINLHLRAMPQVETIGDLESKRMVFEARMVLLKVMTTYANILLHNRLDGRGGETYLKQLLK